MQPDTGGFRLIRRIAAKEVNLFFASPVAYLFLAAFAAVTLFIFFWGEAFFSRNIADVRPMFEWMPLLLVFLASTLTMRLWSEERRTGTLEHVLTQPVPLWQFVLGKFAGCLLLLGVALLITLPLPLTVAWLGDLDWGPVWAGYLAAFLLGAAYLSIGLFVSAKSDNQIVSLISSVALCGVFYLLGTGLLTSFFGTQAGEWLRLLGTGSRFESITRGMIDFRDLYYYLSITGVFLALNTFVLERERWAGGGDRQRHRQWQTVTVLLAANLVGANFWLGQVSALRVDATEGNQFSISDATRNYLAQLQEPLLLRGYFSGKTHPLLAPLVPQLRDLMREYEIAGQGRVRIEFVDPVEDAEAAEQASQQYGIEAVPFQVADRYQSSIVSSWFNVLVQYGDEYEVLGYDDLIEVRGGAAMDINVQLRNPEHDLTRAVRGVLGAYQAGGNLFETVSRPLTFEAYVSPDEALPEELVAFRESVAAELEARQENAGGRLQVRFTDPEAGDGGVAERLAADYGFRPMSTSLFSDESFWFYMTLRDGEQAIQIPLGDLSEAGFERNLDAAIKRFASGFTRTVAVVAPGAGANPMAAQMGAMGPRYNQLRSFVGAELNLQDEDLADGAVSGEADLLLLLGPENLSETELFAVDQFLMKGGTVIAATSPYRSNLSGDTLSLQRVDSGLEDWLAHHGIEIGESLVMDTQSAAFPVPVARNVGGFTLREWRMLDYPYFIDVRGEALNEGHLITAELPQATLAWSSPITVSEEGRAGREVTELMRSSPESWLSQSLDIMPAVNAAGETGYRPEGEQASHLLGVVSAGRFDSWFAGRESPLLARQAEQQGGAAEDAEAAPAGEEEAVISGVIERSPESARLIVVSSNDFLRDQVVQLLGTAAGGEYLNTLQLAANAIDWSLEDTGLLSIRARGNFNRTLPPLEQGQQMFWEYLNYSLAGGAIGLAALVQRRRRNQRRLEWAELIEEENA